MAENWLRLIRGVVLLSQQILFVLIVLFIHWVKIDQQKFLRRWKRLTDSSGWQRKINRVDFEQKSQTPQNKMSAKKRGVGSLFFFPYKFDMVLVCFFNIIEDNRLWLFSWCWVYLFSTFLNFRENLIGGFPCPSKSFWKLKKCHCHPIFFSVSLKPFFVFTQKKTVEQTL